MAYSEQYLESQVQNCTKILQTGTNKAERNQAENKRMYWLNELVKLDERRMYLTT